MAAIPLYESAFAELKKRLSDLYEEIRSSHMSEALAFAAGFKTNAALRAAFVGPAGDRPFVLLDSARFFSRLVTFGYSDDPEFDFEFGPWLKGTGVVSTIPQSGYSIEYKTKRQRAWRNLMVCGINAGLQQKLFTLRPGDDRFEDNMRSGYTFAFTLPNGLPALGSVADAGHDELDIHVAVNPKGDRVRDPEAGFKAGDVFGRTWLDRARVVCMQDSYESFRCRGALLDEFAELRVEPQGFGDRSAVHL